MSTEKTTEIAWDHGRAERHRAAFPDKTDATPAPLDPKAVKAGDTVTLEADGGRKVTAPVSERTLPGKARGTWFLDVYPDDGPVSFSAAHWTLTDHQPAPEPEPAPGYYTVHPTANPEAVWTGLVFEDGSFVGEEDGFYRSASAGEFSVSARLVVIDPAAARQSLEDNGWGAHETADILEHLGLNR